MGVCVSLRLQAFLLLAPSSSVAVVIMRIKMMMVAEIRMMKMIMFAVITKMIKMIMVAEIITISSVVAVML